MTETETLRYQVDHWRRQAQVMARIIHDLTHHTPNGLQDSSTWQELCAGQDDEIVMAWEEGLEEVAGRDWTCERCKNASSASEM